MYSLMDIHYVTKEEMLSKYKYPYYGYTIPNTGIWIQEDLPEKVKISVAAHEAQHYNDNAFSDDRVWYWEFRAWKSAFKASPIGFFQAIWMSMIDVERIKLYLQRIIKGF